MSKLQSAHGVKLSKVRDLRPSDAMADSGSPGWNRIGSSSDQGVWSAALAMGFAAFLMPVWFLAVGTVFGAHGEGTHGGTVHIVHLATLITGALILCGAAIAAWLLGRAPRLARGPHRSAIRWTAIAAAVGAVLFINCCLTDISGIGSDAIAWTTAMLPALLMAEVSVALPVITKNRHGVGVARLATLGWIGAAASVVAAAAMPTIWWLPMLVSTIGAYCTGIASMRVWRHYEGRLVQA